jgi:uncharacterized protein with GYD domain
MTWGIAAGRSCSICTDSRGSNGHFYFHLQVHRTRHSKHSRIAQTGSGIQVSRKENGDIYWTLGSFDGIVIFDAPDDERATAAILHLASQGNVQTATARAFDASAIEKVIGMLAKK